jgi:hypothetical protein
MILLTKCTVSIGGGTINIPNGEGYGNEIIFQIIPRKGGTSETNGNSTRTIKPNPVTGILRATIAEDSEIIEISKDIDQIEKGSLSSFYYSQGKIFAKHGIAKVGFIKKKLNRITRIPFKDEDYIKDGVKVEKKCVYSIRLGEKEERHIIIRILKKWIDKIEIELYLALKNE